ncbi:unnamed protein product [Ceutorhynchus assimilis]|uniref:Coiled-coil domain-containing protein n=1 Tax=Ceutorhynchus assimilis TaxID=467358 RepID=A0A9N9QI08_9CUCU|nr:unnamed protein product [Ceutorhynchus assimilis]
MPKKFATENTKAVQARERKKAAKDDASSKKEKEQEDAKWRDDDKQILKKQQKKEADERKRQEQIQRKAEAKALLDKEMGSIKINNKPPPPAKVTRAQIQSKKEEPPKKKESENAVTTYLDEPLVENLNRLQIDGEEARTVDEAIQILGGPAGDHDKHPEKRMKAAYTAYEERRLAELKLENPSLRLSQLKQMIFKEWQKSPENPLNKV